MRKKFNLSDCIVIGDARRLEKGKEPVKSKRQLAKLLFEREDVSKQNLHVDNVYFKIYRYELDGFILRNEAIIKGICRILYVTEKELIKEA